MKARSAFEFLTNDVAVSYRPRRMPWEHDQDSNDVRQQVLRSWVALLERYEDQTVKEAFAALMRHQPTVVPTLNEARAQLQRVDGEHPPARPAGRDRTVGPETGWCIAYEAYCEYVTSQGRTPDETLFTKKFEAFFGGSQ